jgi:chromosome segregation ATPase
MSDHDQALAALRADRDGWKAIAQGHVETIAALRAELAQVREENERLKEAIDSLVCDQRTKGKEIERLREQFESALPVLDTANDVLCRFNNWEASRVGDLAVKIRAMLGPKERYEYR